jgi:small subunit ribosomal protein S4
MKLSNFGLQLREKQKVKRIYGIYERQFRSYFAKAASKKAVTGAILFQILERRLDNTVFQCGFATSRSQARQLIGHGFMSVNDRPVNISSYLIKQGDEISVRSDKKGNKIVKKIIEKTNERTVPAWLEVDKERLKAKVMRLPERSDVDFPANEQLIVELYSR